MGTPKRSWLSWIKFWMETKEPKQLTSREQLARRIGHEIVPVGTPLEEAYLMLADWHLAELAKREPKEPHYCKETLCLRYVLPPHIYCDNHLDKSSTPEESE